MRICVADRLLHDRGMLTDPAGLNGLTSAIIGCGVQVHRTLGPGLYESVYTECLEYELRLRGLRLELERPVPVIYRGVKLRSRFYIDLVVEGSVAVELKVIPALAEIHRRQVLTQLRLGGLPVGLLMNFNVVTLTDGGIKRVVNPAWRVERTEGKEGTDLRNGATEATERSS